MLGRNGHFYRKFWPTRTFQYHRSHFDGFRPRSENKKQFFDSLNSGKEKNLALKISLCEEAEKAAESTQFDATAKLLISLQEKWKSIGPVHESKNEEIWMRFRSACDKFFKRKEEFYKVKNVGEKENQTIKERIIAMAGPDIDLVITEVGGTVGDIESQPFLEAIRQIRQTVGRDNVFYLHVSLVPYIGPSGELKTKPTQHSVAALRSIGIAPDAIVLRSDREIPEGVKKKISLMCDVDSEAVVAAVDAPSIYDIPKVLHSEGLDSYVVKRLGFDCHDVVWGEWDALLEKVHHPKHHIKVGLVGKYIDLPDAYLSVSEALRAGGFANLAKIEIVWIASDECETPEGAKKHLSNVDAICVPGGFGIRGIEGKVGALKFARENKIPTLGLCLGLQCMVIEAARHLAGINDAISAEFSDAGTPVIATMDDQKDVVSGKGDLGGTMRLGLYKADLLAGSVVAQTYGSTEVSERHRHRYEVNNKYRDQISNAGLVFSGVYKEQDLVEFVELPQEVHPYYVGTQAHPELRSRPTRPHPLFVGLIAAAVAAKG